MYYILLWLFVGLYTGQIAHHYVAGGRSQGYYGDLAIGIAGSEIGGLIWLYSDQQEGPLGALFFGVLGASCLIAFVWLVGIRHHHQQVFDKLILTEDAQPDLPPGNDNASIRRVNRANTSALLNPIKIIHIKKGSLHPGEIGEFSFETSTFMLSDVQRMSRKPQTSMSKDRAPGVVGLAIQRTHSVLG